MIEWYLQCIQMLHSVFVSSSLMPLNGIRRFHFCWHFVTHSPGSIRLIYPNLCGILARVLYSVHSLSPGLYSWTVPHFSQFPKEVSRLLLCQGSIMSLSLFCVDHIFGPIYYARSLSSAFPIFTKYAILRTVNIIYFSHSISLGFASASF